MRWLFVAAMMVGFTHPTLADKVGDAVKIGDQIRVAALAGFCELRPAEWVMAAEDWLKQLLDQKLNPPPAPPVFDDMVTGIASEATYAALQERKMFGFEGCVILRSSSELKFLDDLVTLKRSFGAGH